MAVFTVINRTELGSTNATLVDMTSISSAYDHLYVVTSARGSASEPMSSYKVQFNNDSGTTNYDYVNYYTQQHNGSVSVERNGSQPTVAAYPRMPGATNTASAFNNFTMWVPNYASTSNFKTVVINNGAGGLTTSTNEWYVYYIAGMWSSTAAINRITIVGSSSSFAQYSSFTLYGVTNDA